MLRLFRDGSIAEDTGLVHCQTGALEVATQRMFDWLDEYL